MWKEWDGFEGDAHDAKKRAHALERRCKPRPGLEARRWRAPERLPRQSFGAEEKKEGGHPSSITKRDVQYCGLPVLDDVRQQ